ncbi:MAG: toprim domain-containing protein, partial [Candidatus Binatia bacterium]
AAAGLVGQNARGVYYDRFRARIMFPIADTQGRIVAFGGRVVPWHETGQEGKYINSPRTELYEKRKVVYNLNRAKEAVRQGAPCIVVEGYLDVVMLHQTGVPQVVASSGTAFTSEHIKQLHHYTDTLHFAFDADAAGWRATVAATEGALAAGMKVAVIRLPTGADPADVALARPKEIVKVMAATTPLATLLLTQLKTASSGPDQEAQLEALLPFVRRVANPIQQGTMVQDVAGTLHVPEAKIIEMLAALPSQTPSMSHDQEKREVTASPQATVEHQLLGLLLLDATVRQELFAYLDNAFFLDSTSQVLYNSLQQVAESEGSFYTMSTDEVVSKLRAEEIPFAQAVISRAEEVVITTSNTPLVEGRLLFRAMQRRTLKKRLLSIQSELSETGQRDRVAALRRFQELAEQLASLDNS